MTATRWALAAAAGTAAVAGLRQVNHSAEHALPPEVKWHLGWSDGLAEAKRTGKPLYVVFRCER